jgi:hypothetical protein
MMDFRQSLVGTKETRFLLARRLNGPKAHVGSRLNHCLQRLMAMSKWSKNENRLETRASSS